MTCCSISVRVNGRLRLFNTMEEFIKFDKAKLLNDLKSNPVIMDDFYMIAFADLKKHKYFYHVLHPSYFDPSISIKWNEKAIDDSIDLKGIRRFAMDENLGWYYYDMTRRMCSPEGSDDSLICLVDPGPTIDGVLGWPARNHLMRMATMKGNTSFDLLCIRQGISDTKMFTIMMTNPSLSNIQVTGWEKNELGQVSHTKVDLAPLMDPKRLAREASELNLRLIKWRLLPDLDLDCFSRTKCLLFGAGTLGCNVTRMLLAWGVRNITLVDNGRVSFSNPPRQSLFKFEDCLGGGAPKAETAARRALEIDPNAVDALIDSLLTRFRIFWV